MLLKGPVMSIDVSKFATVLNGDVSSARAGKLVSEAQHVPIPVSERKLGVLSVKPEKSEKALTEVIEKINQQMAANKLHLGFSKDASVNGTVIVVTNSATGEVIRKIPSEDVIRIAHSIEALKGILYSKEY